MTALVNLVRLNRWHLDEKRRKLSDLERLAKRLREDLGRLDQGIDAERRAAEASEDARQAYPAFITAELQRRQRLEASIADVENELEDARDEVAIAFQELKKYELALENQRRRDREQQDRQEQATLDEIGVDRHRRQKSDGTTDE